MKVILITGASSGIGFHTARILAQHGNKVYAGARRLERMDALKEFGVNPISLDVTSDASAKAAVEEIIAKEGRIDVLVNNAGYGSLGPIECVPLEEAQKQLDVNLLGVVRMTDMVLPYMKAQKSGRIVNISSIAGRVTILYGGWYNASKYALEAISDASRMELKRYGIDVCIIEPGGVYSNWGLIAADNLRKTTERTDYEASATKMADTFECFYGKNPFKLLTSTERAAKYVCKAAEARRPKTRYTFGLGSGTMLFSHAYCPTRWFDKVATSIFEMKIVSRFVQKHK